MLLHFAQHNLKGQNLDGSRFCQRCGHPLFTPIHQQFQLHTQLVVESYSKVFCATRSKDKKEQKGSISQRLFAIDSGTISDQRSSSTRINGTSEALTAHPPRDLSDRIPSRKSRVGATKATNKFKRIGSETFNPPSQLRTSVLNWDKG